MSGNSRSLDRFRSEFPPQNATRASEAALCARIKAGDEDAIGELVLPHLRFAMSIAINYHRRYLSIPLEDFNSAAMAGMLRAARTFDADRGTRFCSYAVAWCRQACQVEVARFGAPVSVPIGAFQGFAKARAFYDKPENCRRQPSLYDAKEVTSAMDGKMAFVAPALVHMQPHRHLDAPATKMHNGADEGRTFRDTLPSPAPLPDAALSDDSRKAFVGMMLSALPPRSAYIVRRYFLDGLSLDAVGEELGVCRERVRQLKNEALAALREDFHSEALAEMLD